MINNVVKKINVTYDATHNKMGLSDVKQKKTQKKTNKQK